MKQILPLVLLIATSNVYASSYDDRNDDSDSGDASATSSTTVNNYPTTTVDQNQDQTASGGTATVGTVSPSSTGGTGTGGHATNDGNRVRTDSSFFSLNVGAPNIDGCIVGGSVGGGGDSGGGLIQWGRINHDCFMNAMGEAERHVEMRARLKCGSKHFRNAIAFDSPKSERREKCISYATDIWRGEISYLKETASLGK